MAGGTRVTSADVEWHCVPGLGEETAALFADLAGTLALSGELITSGPYNRLVRVSSGGERFYVKQYATGGKYLRRFLGRSRVRAEWENLQLFRSLGIPTAELVAFGEEGGRRADRRGAVVTREIEGAVDLDTLAAGGALTRMEPSWRRRVLVRLAHHVAHLHNHRFVHSDLKWRNVLVTVGERPEVYLIDSPLGRRMSGPFLTRGAVKDLACLDKVGRRELGSRARARFYLEYRKHVRLPLDRRRMAKRIVRFFAPGE